MILRDLGDELDDIGINAFFPLTLEEEATDLDTLSAGARAVADQIETVHKRTGKPVLADRSGFSFAPRGHRQALGVAPTR